MDHHTVVLVAQPQGTVCLKNEVYAETTVRGPMDSTLGLTNNVSQHRPTEALFPLEPGVSGLDVSFPVDPDQIFDPSTLSINDQDGNPIDDADAKIYISRDGGPPIGPLTITEFHDLPPSFFEGISDLDLEIVPSPGVGILMPVTISEINQPTVTTNNLSDSFDDYTDAIITSVINNPPPPPPEGAQFSFVTEPVMVSSNFELSINAETNGNTIELDLLKTIDPELQESERDKKVIILDVQKVTAKVGYWTRWMWAMMSGSITESLLRNMYQQGLLSQTPDWTEDFWVNYWYNNTSVPWINTNNAYVGWTWEQWKDYFMLPGADRDDFSNDPYDSTKWDFDKLDDEPFWHDHIEGTFGFDRGYWDHIGAPNIYTTSNNNIDNHTASPKYGTPTMTQDQLDNMPTSPINETDKEWNPVTNTWTHKSPSSKFSTASGSTYVKLGKINYNVELVIGSWNGYAKPFTMVTPPMQILYVINPYYGVPEPAPGDPPPFSPGSILDFILGNTDDPPTISVPAQFVLT
jgi:hypothetical protein